MLEAIFQQLADCVMVIDHAGHLLQMNPAALNLLGIRDLDSANATGLSEFIHPDDRKAFQRLHLAACNGQEKSLEFRVLARDDRQCMVECRSTPLLDPKTGVTHHLAVARDLRDQASALTALKQSQQQVDFVLSAANIGEWSLNLKTWKTTRSPTHDRCFGYLEPPQRWSYEVFLEHLHPEDRARARQNMAMLSVDKPRLDDEYRITWPDGSEHWIWVRASIHKDTEGAAESINGIVIDTTDRKRAEAAAAINYDRWKVINQGVTDGVWDWDIASGTVYYSDSWAAMLGHHPDELSTSADEWHQRVHPDDDRHTKARVRDTLSGKVDSFTSAHRLRCKDGTWKWVLGRGEVLARSADGEALRMVGTNVDIAPAQRQAQSIEHVRERLELAIRGSGFGVWEFILENGELIWDTRMHEIYGYLPESFDGVPESWRACLHELDAPLVDERFQRLLDGHFDQVDLFEYRIRRVSDGEERHIEANGYLQRDALGKPQRLVGMNRDITERWRSDQRLRLLGTSLANTRDMVLIVQLGSGEQLSEIIYGNDPFLERTGYPATDLGKLKLQDLCDTSANKNSLAMLDEAINSSTTGRCDLLVGSKSGEQFWVDLELTPAADETGEITHWVIIGLEITGRMQAQAKLLELNASLEQRVQDRTAVLDETIEDLRTFTYSVSHDLHAPLRAINGWAQALAEDCAHSLDDKGRGHLQRILQGAEQMGDLVDGLLRLTRLNQRSLENRTIDLAPGCHSVFDRLRLSDPQRVVVCHIDQPLIVHGDRSLLALCLTNLIENAWKFSQTLAHARIELRCIDRDNETVIEVSDNGVGFDMKREQELWEPFQRIGRDNDYPGLGIGLAVVNRIVSRHGGRVEASSVLGEGAQFRIILPRLD